MTMDSKHIKVDKNQQFEKLKNITPYGLCGGHGGALVIAYFQGHLCVFYNTTGDSLQPGTSPVVETSCPDSPVAKKRKNALFHPGT